MFSINLPTEQAQLVLDLSVLMDGTTKRLTMPFTGAAPGELTFSATLLAAETAVDEKKSTRLRERVNTIADGSWSTLAPVVGAAGDTGARQTAARKREQGNQG